MQLAEVALNLDPFSYDPKAAAKASNPNRRRKWLIPLVLAAQVSTFRCSAAPPLPARRPVVLPPSCLGQGWKGSDVPLQP